MYLSKGGNDVSMFSKHCSNWDTKRRDAQSGLQHRSPKCSTFLIIFVHSNAPSGAGVAEGSTCIVSFVTRTLASLLYLKPLDDLEVFLSDATRISLFSCKYARHKALIQEIN
jgi:hypothetical protein